MRVVLSPQAEKRLRKLAKIDQIAIAQKIGKIREQKEFSSGQKEKLQGYPDIFRVRVGDYRLVYRKFPDRLYIILLGHRQDVYEILRRWLG